MTANDFRNSYGYQKALSRKKQREENKAARTPVSAVNKKKPEPEINFYPMEKYHGPSFDHIVWGANTDISDVMVRRATDEKLTILKLPTGLGKTALAVETMGKLQERAGEQIPFVVIVPKQVLVKHGWHKTIAAWNKAHPTNIINPVTIEAPDRFANILDNAKSLRKLLAKMNDNSVVVIDEVHNYKSPTGKRAKKLSRLSKFHKLGLSATPLTNDAITDSISYLVMSGRYNSKNDFLIKSGLDQFVGKYGAYMVYNKDGAVNSFLWPYYEVMIEEMSDIVYSPSVNMDEIDMPNVKAELVQLPHDENLSANMKSLLKAYKRRAFDSPVDYMMAMIETIANAETRLDKLIDIISQPGVKQPLIFYWHNSTLNALETQLQKEGMTYQIISGAHPADQVDLSIDAPILIQYQSGSEGIEMPLSNTSVFYQNQNSYSRLKQAKGRNVRRGNSHTVTQYTLLADHQFDNTIFERLVQRQETSMAMLAEIAVKSNE